MSASDPMYWMHPRTTMRSPAPAIWRYVLLTLILMVSGVAWAQPHGYAVNSRGDFDDDSRVFALWRIDLSSGEAGYVGDTGQGEFIDVEGLAFQAPDKIGRASRRERRTVAEDR